MGYVKSAKPLRQYLKTNSVDLVHAHYVLSGWTSVLSFTKHPIVLSLMGSDAYGDYIGKNKIKFLSKYLTILTYLIQPFVNAIICKSEHIQSFIYLKKKSTVIPNGIQLENITFNERGYRKELSLSEDKKYILFLGSKSEIRKNFKAVEESYHLLNKDNVSLISPYPISHELVVKYLNSVDVIVVPSFMEGSPNVVKEAMACNCPVVATDVGDVKWLFGDEPGHFITGFETSDLVDKINAALNFSEKYGRTNGLNRLKDLKLDAPSVAEKIIQLYKTVL